MTVGRLKEALEKYPDDMNVKIAMGYQLDSLADVSWGVDMDTNICSVWLCGKKKGRK